MSSIEPSLSERLSAELFERVVVPLAATRHARSEPPYYPAQRDENAASYFSSPTPSSMNVAEFALSVHGTPEHLIAGLAAFWKATGDPDLCSLIPLMSRIASVPQDEAVENDGSVSVFCYAMF